MNVLGNISHCRYGLCRPVEDIPECQPGEVARKQYNGVRDIGYLKYTQVF